MNGFNAMGHPVPKNRLQKGYDCVKEILSCDNETAWSIANRTKYLIEKDQCSFIIGHTDLSGEIKRAIFEKGSQNPCYLISKIDLTGRYRLLSEMLTD